MDPVSCRNGRARAVVVELCCGLVHATHPRRALGRHGSPVAETPPASVDLNIHIRLDETTENEALRAGRAVPDNLIRLGARPHITLMLAAFCGATTEAAAAAVLERLTTRHLQSHSRGNARKLPQQLECTPFGTPNARQDCAHSVSEVLLCACREAAGAAALGRVLEPGNINASIFSLTARNSRVLPAARSDIASWTH